MTTGGGYFHLHIDHGDVGGVTRPMYSLPSFVSLVIINHTVLEGCPSPDLLIGQVFPWSLLVCISAHV